MNDLKQYINDHFLNPELKHRGYAYQTIRSSIFESVKEFKTLVKGRVIDLGCGIMPYKEYLLEGGKIEEYIGIDLKGADYESVITPDKFWDGKIIPVEDNSCDFVIATEFFEHYHDSEHIFQEIFRILKPRGCLFFTVPCIWEIHGAPYDEYRFTPFSLQKKFEQVGFQKIELKPLGDINKSLIIIFGLWLENSNLKTYQKKIFTNIFKPLYQFLLKRSNRQFEMSNGSLPSGIYGFIYK